MTDLERKQEIVIDTGGFFQYLVPIFCDILTNAMPKDNTCPLQFILRHQAIPWWERDGLKRLVVSEPTIHRFKAQPLPTMMKVSSRQRRSKKIVRHGPRPHSNMVTSFETYPDDAQDTCRHPILYYIAKGTADLRIANYLVRCPTGHFVLMRPGVPQPDGSQPHLENDNNDGYCEILHMSLLPGAASVGIWLCYSQKGQHWGEYHREITQDDIVAQFRLFMREILGQQPAYGKIAANALHNFLLQLLRELDEGRLYSNETWKSFSPSASNEDMMTFAFQYMESHLHQHLTSAAVAEIVFMSRSSFLRYFKKVTGQNFNQYLTALRLKKAKELLASSSLTIQAISARVGIRPAQLYRIFQKHLNMSPSAYRQKIGSK